MKPGRFKQSDLTRAVKGCQAAGVQVARLEIDAQGKIIVLFGVATSSSENEWNEVLT